MKRGPIVIVIILVVALSAAGFSVWYHYRNQRRVQDFWGSATAQLIDKAPQVEVLKLGEPGLSLGDDVLEEPAGEEKPADPDAPPRAQFQEFNQIPWIVVQTKDAAAARGIANLRRALVLDTTFDWSNRAADGEPRWQYALSMNDGRNWATVLFDFDSRQVGLTGGRKTVILDPQANQDFRQFFAEQFPAEAKNSLPDRQDDTKNRLDEQDETRNRQDEQDETRNRQDEQE
ncbi:MAG: hypothetical protein WD063_00725 [Pirellulales bacterium]